MRILIVSQYFWPESFKVNDIAFDLASEGHEITVLTAKPNYPKGKFFPGYHFFSPRHEIIKGVKVIRIPIIPRGSGNSIRLVFNYFSFIFFSYWAFLFRLKNEYDISFAHLPSPLLSAFPSAWMKKKYGIPMVLWILDLWPESVQAAGNIKTSFLLNWIDRMVKNIYSHTDLILISSRSFENSIKSKLKKNTPISYFPNWAEDVFSSGKKSSSDDIVYPDGFNILFAGNVGESQDLESILKAALETINEGINWLILGDGRKLSWVKKEIQEKNIDNVHLLGRHPTDMMPTFFRKADAMLVSLKDEFIFKFTVPAKIQAYMAAGKIILGMLNGEGADIINSAKCGYTVNAGDFTGLAQQAVRLAKSGKEEKKQMEINGKQYYNSHFHKDVLFQQLKRQFNEVVQHG